jgi:omega-6 fatty acid desaturase (delta-12 desaturase)
MRDAVIPGPTRLITCRVAQRRSVRAFRQSSDLIATALCAVDISLFVVVLGATVFVSNTTFKAIGAVLLALVICRLFVLGHDACHQSLFTNRTVNRWIGRLVFLPSLTPYSLWEAGHNVGHHVFTNLRGMDYVWTPSTKSEFDAMPRWRQLAERYYRSGWGHGAYFLVELWWKKLFFASRKEIPNQRPMFKIDSALVLAFVVVWLAALCGAAIATHQSIVLLVVTGFVVPFALWNCVMGSVIYFHHTHPLLPWYDDIDQWEAARDAGPSTVHVAFPGKLGWLLNNIMEHPAHHLDVRIPLPTRPTALFVAIRSRLRRTLQALRLSSRVLDRLRRAAHGTCVAL